MANLSKVVGFVIQLTFPGAGTGAVLSNVGHGKAINNKDEKIYTYEYMKTFSETN
jgi:hypothetical protein